MHTAKVLKNHKMLASFIFIFILLFLNLATNFLHTTPNYTFAFFQSDTEDMILGRMVASRQGGIFSYGGLTGVGNTAGSHYEVSAQYQAFFSDVQFIGYEPYLSQIGAQGWLFSLLDQALPFSSSTKYELFRALYALLTAVMLTLLIFWFYREMGKTVALFVFIFSLFSECLVLFSRNLWWSTWAFYLPLVAGLFYLGSKTNISKAPLFFLVFLTSLVKFLFNGYEYISTAAIMTAAPLVYYLIKNRLKIKESMLCGLALVAGYSSALLTSFIILCIQIASLTGNPIGGITHILYSLEKRSYGDPTLFPPEIAASLQANPLEILIFYIRGPFISAPYLSLSYLQIILFLILSTLLILFLRRKAPPAPGIQALLITTWFSILAPLSWFILFKGHSYIHRNINLMVWQMPFTFFSAAVFGQILLTLVSGFAAALRQQKAVGEQQAASGA